MLLFLVVTPSVQETTPITHPTPTRKLSFKIVLESQNKNQSNSIFRL